MSRPSLSTPRRRLRVLRVINWFNGGGIDNALLEHLSRCGSNDVEVDVLCVGSDAGPNASLAASAGARLLLVEKHPSVRIFSHRVARALQGSSYDVMLTSLSLMGAGPLMAAKQMGIPVRICGFHSSRPNTLLGLTRFRITDALRSRYIAHLSASIKKSATAYYSVGSAVEAYVRRTCAVSAADEVATIARGFDLRRFAPRSDDHRSQMRAELGIESQDIVLAHAGAFKPEKNHELLVEIARSASRLDKRVVLLLLGDGTLRSSILDSARARSIRVVAPGSVNNVPEHLAAADVFLFPSTREGLPGSVVEAQACGLPVVCSDIPENLEALAPVWHPFVFGLRKGPQDGFQKLLAVLALPQATRHRLATSAREWVEAYFDADENVRRLDTWLHGLVQQSV